MPIQNLCNVSGRPLVVSVGFFNTVLWAFGEDLNQEASEQKTYALILIRMYHNRAGHNPYQAARLFRKPRPPWVAKPNCSM
jgi:hypothetical protein